jgi:hypothetical protein
MNSGTIDMGNAIVLVSYLSEGWALLHTREFH